ncbi:zincin-like metallopeptidase domain-containing protein, partial [Erythrobacter donghaensis]|uniref:zincin-like metallopeptidase domain-containing protein n=1 Tax=Erythrobacter donghaensis TaxID=267135 RepID=UPI0022AA181D
MFSPRHCGPTLPDQIDGLPAHYYPDLAPPEDRPESVHRTAIDAFFATLPIDIRHGGNAAFFSPAGDYIQMPPREAFHSDDHYASTLGHEVCNIASVLISRTVDGL